LIFFSDITREGTLDICEFESSDSIS